MLGNDDPIADEQFNVAVEDSVQHATRDRRLGAGVNIIEVLSKDGRATDRDYRRFFMNWQARGPLAQKLAEYMPEPPDLDPTNDDARRQANSAEAPPSDHDARTGSARYDTVGRSNPRQSTMSSDSAGGRLWRLLQTLLGTINRRRTGPAYDIRRLRMMVVELVAHEHVSTATGRTQDIGPRSLRIFAFDVMPSALETGRAPVTISQLSSPTSPWWIIATTRPAPAIR